MGGLERCQAWRTGEEGQEQRAKGERLSRCFPTLEFCFAYVGSILAVGKLNRIKVSTRPKLLFMSHGTSVVLGEHPEGPAE